MYILGVWMTYDFWCDWFGFAIDKRIYSVPEDIQ